MSSAVLSLLESDLSLLSPISSSLPPYPSAAGILACTSGEYAGGKIKMQNLHLSTPKMCSITLWAEAWWRLKSSSLSAGLWGGYLVNYFAFCVKKDHILHIGPTPLCKMVAHTSIWDQQLIASRITCICIIIFTFWHHKIWINGIIPYSNISGSAFPSSEGIAKLKKK